MSASLSGSVVSGAQHGVDALQQWLTSTVSSFAGLFVVCLVAVLLCAAAIVFARSRPRPELSAGAVPTAVVDVAALLVSVSVAWLVAAWLGGSSPIFASAAALVATYTGLKSSVVEGRVFVVTAAVGLVLGQVTAHVVSWSLAAALAAVGVSCAAGVVCRLKVATTRTLASTALFAAALGTGAGDHVVVDRVLELLVGVLVGVVVAGLPWPNNTLDRARAQVEVLAGEVSVLLSDVASAVAFPVSSVASTRLLDRSRVLLARAREVDGFVGEALEHVQLSPFVSSASTGEVLAVRWTVVRHVVEQTNSLCRDVADAAGRDVRVWPTEFSVAVGLVSDMMAGTAGDDAQVRVGQVLSAARAQVRGTGDTVELMTHGAAVAQLSRLASTVAATPPASVTLDAPVLTDVVPVLGRPGGGAK